MVRKDTKHLMIKESAIETYRTTREGANLHPIRNLTGIATTQMLGVLGALQFFEGEEKRALVIMTGYLLIGIGSLVDFYVEGRTVGRNQSSNTNE
ncbi:MAG: hypothetical protein NUV69_05200 [Candidatus Curtissbacteria bacterium]|nr:hypothetical protein [Candidatus Curtissbacteria bacterium]